MEVSDSRPNSIYPEVWTKLGKVDELNPLIHFHGKLSQPVGGLHIFLILNLALNQQLFGMMFHFLKNFLQF
jgi:hypothetical protein